MTEQQTEATPPPPPPRRWLPSGFSTVRDILAFVAGLGIIGNEVFVSKTAETAVIAVGVAMLGLPAVFGASERQQPPGPPEPPAPPTL